MGRTCAIAQALPCNSQRLIRHDSSRALIQDHSVVVSTLLWKYLPEKAESLTGIPECLTLSSVM